MLHMVGKLSASVESSHFTTLDQLIGSLKKYKAAGDVLYIKGSRSMGMERVISEVYSN